MRILITGGAGFLGAWMVRQLSASGHSLRIFDRVENRALIASIAGSDAARACEWRTGTIVDANDVLSAGEGCEAIIHLAGILTLDCRDDPVRGAQINLIGTLNIFEAARRLGIGRVVYTSTAGVYGPSNGRTPLPISHYGAFKLACEGSARAYWHDHGIGSIGFRPYIVYGPGRENGLSAGPALACRAAARGEPYVFPYEGEAGLVYVADVAAAYEAALLRQPGGAHVFNLIGTLATPQDVIDELKRLAPNAAIRRGGDPMPSAPDIDEGDVRQVLMNLPSTSLRDGVRRTFAYYRDGVL